MYRIKNYVIMTLDGVRADAARALGNPDLITPHLDALCARGTSIRGAFLSGGDGRFDRPAEAMMHTGRFLSGLAEEGKRIPADHALLGETLREAGCRTFGVGRWRTDPDAFSRSFGAGEILPEGGSVSASRCADLACTFLEDVREDPFFLYVGFGAPEEGSDVPGRFSALYDPSALKLPFGLEDTEGNRLRLRDAYAWISCQDEAAGRILETIRGLNLEDNTLVIVTALRGCSLGQHGTFGDVGWQDEYVRVPMIAAGPRTAKNDGGNALISFSGIFPTVCRLAGLPVPSTVQGRECSSCLAEPAGPSQSCHFFLWSDKVRSIMRAKMALVVLRDGETYRQERYDLMKDPYETNPIPGWYSVEELLDSSLEEYSLVFEDRTSPASRAFWGPSQRRKCLE